MNHVREPKWQYKIIRRSIQSINAQDHDQQAINGPEVLDVLSLCTYLYFEIFVLYFYEFYNSKKTFWKIFEKKLFCRPLDQNWAVLTEFLTSDLSVRSVRVTQVANKVLDQYFRRKL